MKNSEAVAAAQHFLDTVWLGVLPSEAALVASLDRLLAAYHVTPLQKFIGDWPTPPERDWKADQKRIARRFPDFGFYAVANPLEPDPRSAAEIGDAIDDLSDICGDMRDTIWLAEHVGTEAAHWHFRSVYFHWSQHARELSLYLIARQNR